MPGTYTYPGVYIEEVPSGVHAIAGVSTAETAFVDFFPRGPLETAVRITSFGDFGRIFGGLDPRSEASYAIQQYYLNGGQIAWVVRTGVGDPTPASRMLLASSPPSGSLKVSAANPGAWGRNLEVAVIQGAALDRFDLFVREVAIQGGKTQVLALEEYRGLSMSIDDRRYAIDVVNAGSSLVTLEDQDLGAVPLAVAPTSSGGAPEDAFEPLDTGGDDGDAFDADGGFDDEAGFATALEGNETDKTGIHALDSIDPFVFNILCLPVAAKLDETIGSSLVAAATTYCEDHRAFLIVDIPESVHSVDGMIQWAAAHAQRSKNAAVYFPRVLVPDPLNEGRPRNAGPSGVMAGVFARTDANRGVWKAPAGIEARLRGVTLATVLNDQENGALNPLGINVLRTRPVFGNISFGGRTLDGADQLASEWKYIPVRRTALYIEESLRQGLAWVVFEPNDEPLWAQIRLNTGAFMQTLFRQGAFQGSTPRDAYFVKCDAETTTPADVGRGVVNILVGFAPLQPAEFVVIRIQQMASQAQL